MVPSREDRNMTLKRQIVSGVVAMMATGRVIGLTATGRSGAGTAGAADAADDADAAGRSRRPVDAEHAARRRFRCGTGARLVRSERADADKPTLTIYRASRRASGTAVVVAPGGGYTEPRDGSRGASGRGVLQLDGRQRVRAEVPPRTASITIRSSSATRSAPSASSGRARAGVRRAAGSDRDDGLLRGRPPGFDRGDTLRQRQGGRRGSHRSRRAAGRTS